MIGNTLSHYKILSKLGQGGMGEVYLAEDSRLDRKVALKILPQHLSDRAELRERFEREARAVSSLNHPHICTLHDIGEQDGIHYLVMEHLVGETLEGKKRSCPFPNVQDYPPGHSESGDWLPRFLLSELLRESPWPFRQVRSESKRLSHSPPHLRHDLQGRHTLQKSPDRVLQSGSPRCWFLPAPRRIELGTRTRGNPSGRSLIPFSRRT